MTETRQKKQAKSVKFARVDDPTLKRPDVGDFLPPPGGRSKVLAVGGR
jgi:hypothetical protein